MTELKCTSSERWLNVCVVIGAIVVYLSIYLQSPRAFAVGEILCAGAAVIIGWRHRQDIRQWWLQRSTCPNCGQSVSPTSDTCPDCGHERLG